MLLLNNMAPFRPPRTYGSRIGLLLLWPFGLHAHTAPDLGSLPRRHCAGVRRSPQTITLHLLPLQVHLLLWPFMETLLLHVFALLTSVQSGSVHLVGDRFFCTCSRSRYTCYCGLRTEVRRAKTLLLHVFALLTSVQSGSVHLVGDRFVNKIFLRISCCIGAKPGFCAGDHMCDCLCKGRSSCFMLYGQEPPIPSIFERRSRRTDVRDLSSVIRVTERPHVPGPPPPTMNMILLQVSVFRFWS